MKGLWINKDKIIEARINEPYEPDINDMFDTGTKHGWQVVLIMGFTADGYPIKILIDKESEKQCMELLSYLNLYRIINPQEQ